MKMTVRLVAVAMISAGVSWAQGGLTARLHPSGMVQIFRGNDEVATFELNAHGPQWKHAPQGGATAQASDLPGGGKQFAGVLPVANTTAGAGFRFREAVKPTPTGLQLSYDVAPTHAMKINGLQVSARLPVARYGGKELLITQGSGEPQGAILPAVKNEQTSSIWSGEGASFQLLAGTPEAFAIELHGVTDAMVQDLRQWEQEVYELRLPAIMEDGRDLTTDDRFHLDLNINLGGPVKLLGP